MIISIRKFCEDDIPLKIQWINDSNNNRYLHYSLPLREDETKKWFKKSKEAADRLDMTILCDEKPIGIIGLLKIDRNRKNAELYITIGEQDYKGIGIAGKAIQKLLRIGFYDLKLQSVYLYTEAGNFAAIKAYEKFGFLKESVVQRKRQNPESSVTAYRYVIAKEEFEERYES